MTKITTKTKKWPKYPLNQKMTKIPLKHKKIDQNAHKLKNYQNTPRNLKKWLKFPQNLKIDQNTPKPKKWPKYSRNLKIDKNTP